MISHFNTKSEKKKKNLILFKNDLFYIPVIALAGSLRLWSLLVAASPVHQHVGRVPATATRSISNQHSRRKMQRVSLLTKKMAVKE